MAKNKQKLAKNKFILPKGIWRSLLFGLGIIILVGFGFFLTQTRGDVQARVIGEQGKHQVDRPLRLRLSQQISNVRPSISPQIKGRWTKVNKLFGVLELEFRPESNFRANTEYDVSLTDVKRVMFGEAESSQVKFKTERAPSLIETSVDKPNKEQQPVAMDHVFSAKLSSRAGPLRDLELISSPELPLKRFSTDDVNFEWRYDGYLQPDAEYTLIIRDKVQKEELRRLTVKTVPAPDLKNPIKERYVTPQDELKMEFTEAIDPKNRPNIDFSLAGSGEWLSDTEYLFKPEKPVEPGKTYSYTLPQGLRTARGGVLTEASGRSFSSNGVVQVVGTYPRGYELSQGSQAIKITFDQPVDRKSAEERFRVSAGTVRGFSWQGNTLVAQVVNFGFQNSVSVSVEPGVRPIFGLSSAARTAWYFTTEARVVKLSVPYYPQAHAQSCEAANLRMALAYRGVHDSDWNILQKFGYNPRPRDKENNVWDDPNQQFVGDVNGDQAGGTGWGVYAGPVSRAAGQYGRSTSVAYGANVGFAASQIYAGNPAIVWGIWGGSARIDSWNTPSGGKVSGPMIMHVRLIVGVKGEPGNPLGFYIHDPITGPAYWTVGQFITNTSAAGPAAQLLAIH